MSVELKFWEDGSFKESVVRVKGYSEALLFRRGRVKGKEVYRVCPPEAPSDLKDSTAALTTKAFEDHVFTGR